MKWFKFYGQDWLTDTKILQLSVEDRLCFITLLCLASSNDDDIGTIRSCNESVIIRLSGIENDPYETVNSYTRAVGCLDRLNDNKMITRDNAGNVIISNFSKRQGENLTGYERVKKYREKQNKRNVAKNKVIIRKNKVIKDNTPDVINDNDRIEESRVEENRIDTNTTEQAPNDKKTLLKFEAQDLELAILLRDLIVKNTPTFKEPDLSKWAEHCRLMREVDLRTTEQIRFLITWSQKNSFWSANILSTRKLREKFDQLVAQVTRESHQKKNGLSAKGKGLA
jgi:hypothetical protein